MFKLLYKTARDKSALCSSPGTIKYKVSVKTEDSGRNRTKIFFLYFLITEGTDAVLWLRKKKLSPNFVYY